MDHQGAIDSMSTSYQIFVCGVEGAISYGHIVRRYCILELFVVNMLPIPVLFPTAHDRLSLLLKYNAFDVFSIHKCAGHLSLIRPLLQ